MATETIQPNELRAVMGNGRAVTLIDVRTPAEFRGVHAVGAESIPLDEIDAAAQTGRFGNSGDPIYVICASGTRSADAVRRLRRAGIGTAISVAGGTRAWEAAGLPVVRGQTGVISLERQVRIVAGAIVLIGALLAWLVSPWFLIVPGFIGAGLIFAGVTNRCGMSMALTRLPWNRS
jgi:rhodanese-related sulfurtransferase